jgi:hypothetical protein
MKLHRIRTIHQQLRFIECDDKTYLFVEIQEYNKILDTINKMHENIEMLKKELKRVKNGI